MTFVFGPLAEHQENHGGGRQGHPGVTSGKTQGKVAEEFSLKPVADYLARLLERPVMMAPDCIGAAVLGQVAGMKAGEVLLLENLRFHPEEEKNDEDFSRQLAELAEVYVNDAFAVSHRAHASVHGITRYAKVCAAGYQLQKEVDYFHKAMEEPKRPLAMVIGGAKISTQNRAPGKPYPAGRLYDHRRRHGQHLP